ncbi:probable palmitoyltransferase ZDHHC24 [Drosophila ficusphila]|uniref:probable palmitoyltransferase ZDHHC24 n=1 Tax=Drosophila ficusphila TaxID=30025 RepID=UPI001C8A6D72|nr:probable palmitoyltransferase ZDHHC24 [Drosophila ficusphila]
MASQEENRISRIKDRLLKAVDSWTDPLAIFLNIFLTLFYYLYDVFYVVPQMLGTTGNAVHFVVTTWIVYNILGNLRACSKTKSSVDTLPPELMQPAKGEEHLWHSCEKCQRTVPPRSWHCKVCNICILKRDHHCSFVANCVGHNNHRYFMWFAFYATLGSTIALVENLLFALRNKISVLSLFSFNGLLLAEYLHRGSVNMALEVQVRLVFYVNICAVLFPGLLFFQQIFLIRRNAVMHNSSDRTYDLGCWKNFAQVLGRRHFWTFLSPSIKSPLPNDGTQWQSKHNV